MLADQHTTNAHKDDSARAQLVAHLTALYQASVKSRHPHAREMARRYEQELKQVAGPGVLSTI